MYYRRVDWGAQPPRSTLRRSPTTEGTLHWSGTDLTPAAEKAAGEGMLPPKPEKPGLRWYRLWRDPNTPPDQRRNISRVIREYNEQMRQWNEDRKRPEKPGQRWYDLWRNPNTPATQRRNISLVIRAYNEQMRAWRALNPQSDEWNVPPHIVELEMRIWRSFQHYHRNVLGWRDIGYHRGFFNSGNVYEGRIWTDFGAHAVNANHTTGYCLVMGPGDVPHERMFDSVRLWMGHDNIRRARGHRQVPGNPTECPGDLIISEFNLPFGY